jgi:GTP pyrophosphokinase
MIRIEDIVEKVSLNHPQADLDLLRRAYLFSAREHKGQRRASGESYLVHPLEVANILADMKLDEVSVATGLLHDVVEDTLVDLETIRKYFGEEITHLVDGLTKIAQISNISREEQQAENVRKMLLAMIDDVRVVLVKLADRLHNMRTLQYLNSEKRKRIAEETMEIFAPIAHRLGMGKLRGELEDLAFRHLHPDDYRELAEQLEKRRPENEAFLKNVTARIEQKMNEAEVPFVRVEGRVKRLYSIWKKLRRQRISLDQVYDLVAVRVITPDTVTRHWALCTTIGSPCPVASKTGLLHPAIIFTSRCILRLSDPTFSRLKFKFALKRCITSPKKALPRIGSTKKGSAVHMMMIRLFRRYVHSSNGRRKLKTPKTSSTP